MLFDSSKFLRWLAPRVAETRQPPQPGDVVIGLDMQGRPFEVPRPTNVNAAHALVLAASGSGKSAMISYLLSKSILFDSTLPKDDQQTILVGDPKGDTIALLIAAIAAEIPSKLSDIIYLSPFQFGIPFNLNLLASDGLPAQIRSRQVTDIVSVVSTSVGAQKSLGAGSRQTFAWLQFFLAALTVPHERANILLAADGLQSEKGQKILAASTTSPEAREYLENTKLSEELRTSCLARLQLCFGATPLQTACFSAPTALNFAEIFSSGKIVLVDLSNPTGGLISLQSLWGNLLFRFMFEYLLAQKSGTARHTRVYLDEAQTLAPVLADLAERVATVGRSLGISATYASQGAALIQDASPTLWKILSTNTPLKIIGRSNVSDSKAFSAEQAPAPGTDESISSLHTSLQSGIVGLKDREFYGFRPGGERMKFRSVDADVAGWRKAAEGRSAEIEEIKRAYGISATQPPRLTLTELAGADKRRSTATASRPTTPKSKWG